MVVLPSIADGAERNRLSTTLEADPQQRLKQLYPADRLDWLWNLFSIIILIIAASFAIETAQRFLTENPGAAGTLSVLAQAVISMAAAGSLLTKRGDEAIVRIMEMLAIPVYRRREVRLGVSVLLLAFTFGFFLALKPIATIYNDVGLQYHERQEYVAAQYAYRLAISLRPDYPAAHYNLGSLHEDLLDMEQAETEYVLAVQGGYLSARNNLARLYLLSGNPAKAVALLGPEHSLPHPTHPATGQSQPENSVVRQRALLADADEARTGQPDESAKLSSNLWKNLGWTRLQLEQYDLALYCLEKAIEANPNNVSANCLFAQSYMATGQEATASPYWRACLAAENEPYQNRPELDPLLRMASDYFMRKGE